MEKKEALERMRQGRLYPCNHPGILEEQAGHLEKQEQYNRIPLSCAAQREQALREMFAQIGEGCYIEPPFHANWGGAHVHFGRQVYANFNLTLVDDGEIYVGDYVMFGPNVTVVTAGHPVEPNLRRMQMQYNREVHIGNNVWIGAGAILLPGVTIGENSVIGAGSIVTRDIPANVVAVGNPCRVLREIGDRDREFYYRDLRVDLPIPEDGADPA